MKKYFKLSFYILLPVFVSAFIPADPDYLYSDQEVFIEGNGQVNDTTQSDTENYSSDYDSEDYSPFANNVSNETSSENEESEDEQYVSGDQMLREHGIIGAKAGKGIGNLELGVSSDSVIYQFGLPNIINEVDRDFYLSFGFDDMPDTPIDEVFVYYKPISPTMHRATSTLEFSFYQDKLVAISYSQDFFNAQWQLIEGDWRIVNGQWRTNILVTRFTTYRQLKEQLITTRCFENSIGDYSMVLYPVGFAVQFSNQTNAIQRVFIFNRVTKDYYGGIPLEVSSAFSRYLDQARESHRRSRYLDSISNYGLALQTYRGSSTAFLEMGNVYFDYYENRASVDEYFVTTEEATNVIDLVINHSIRAYTVDNHWGSYNKMDVFYLLGKALMEKQDYQNSIRAFLRFLPENLTSAYGDPILMRHTKICYEIARVLAILERYDEALFYLNLAFRYGLNIPSSLSEDEAMASLIEQNAFERLMALYYTKFGKKTLLVKLMDGLTLLLNTGINISNALSFLNAIYEDNLLRYQRIVQHNYILALNSEDYPNVPYRLLWEFSESDSSSWELEIPLNDFFSLSNDQQTKYINMGDYFWIASNRKAFIGYFNFSAIHIKTHPIPVGGSDNGTMGNTTLVFYKNNFLGSIFTFSNFLDFFESDNDPRIPVAMNYYLQKFGESSIERINEKNYVVWDLDEFKVYFDIPQTTLVFVNKEVQQQAISDISAIAETIIAAQN